MISGKQILNVYLIDFGYCTKYLDKYNNHIEENNNMEQFKGNFMFASLNQMLFKATSRRDDLQSLLYYIIFFLNDMNFPYLTYPDKMETETKDE